MGGALRLALAVLIAAVTSYAIVSRIPNQLRIHTDIVGSPIFSNFDVNYYFNVYYVVAGVFPLVTLVAFLGTTWLAARANWADPLRLSHPLATHEEPAAERSQTAWSAWTGQVCRVLLVGAVLGLERLIAVGHAGPLTWRGILAVAVGYLAIVFAAAVIARRLRSDGRLRTWVSSINALAAPAVVAGVALASASTSVTVLADGSQRQFPWFPAWLGLLVALVLLGWTTVRLVRAADDARRIGIERVNLVVVVVPVLLFLLLSWLPGELGPIDVFHDGEYLVPARLLGLGYFPWRDVISAHGVLDDTLRSLFGFTLLEPSRWGAFGGHSLVLAPLSAVLMYGLGAYLFRRSWAFLGAFALFVLAETFSPIYFRFLLWPVVLLLLAAVLNRPTTMRLFGLASVLVVEVVMSTEAIYFLPAIGLTIVAFDLYNYDRGRRLIANFRRTLGVALFGAGTVAVIAIYLALNGAIEGILLYYRTFPRGHALTGGVQIHWEAMLPLERFAAIAPLAAAALTALYFGWRIRQSKPLLTEDWVMAAVAIATLLFYPAYLARADAEHAKLAYSVGVPLYFYIAYRALAAVEHALSRAKPWRRIGSAVPRPTALVLLCAAAVQVPVSSASKPMTWQDPGGLLTRVEQSPTRYRPVSTQRPWLDRLGYAGPDAFDQSTYANLKRVLDAGVGPGESVFDFSNEPALYYYLLEYRPGTRYYNVAQAIRADTQADLLAELRRHPPALVIFSNERYGLPSWDDISNEVRHYDVSQWILDNYKPWLISDTQVVYSRGSQDLPGIPEGLDPTPVSGDVVFRGATVCDWGLAPNFLSVGPGSPSGDRPVLDLNLHSAGGAEVLSAPAGTHWTDYRWLELDTVGGFREDAFVLSDQMRWDPHHQVRFKTLVSSPQRYVVRVGSCPQWHAYSSESLYLSHDVQQAIASAHLLP